MKKQTKQQRVITFVALIGFIVLQISTHSLKLLLWQEILFGIIIVIWIRSINTPLWHMYLLILILHVLAILISGFAVESYEKLMLGYWIYLFLCAIPVCLGYLISYYARK